MINPKLKNGYFTFKNNMLIMKMVIKYEGRNRK